MLKEINVFLIFSALVTENVSPLLSIGALKNFDLQKIMRTLNYNCTKSHDISKKL